MYLGQDVSLLCIQEGVRSGSDLSATFLHPSLFDYPLIPVSMTQASHNVCFIVIYFLPIYSELFDSVASSGITRI